MLVRFSESRDTYIGCVGTGYKYTSLEILKIRLDKSVSRMAEVKP